MGNSIIPYIHGYDLEELIGVDQYLKLMIEHNKFFDIEECIIFNTEEEAQAMCDDAIKMMKEKNMKVFRQNWGCYYISGEYPKGDKKEKLNIYDISALTGLTIYLLEALLSRCSGSLSIDYEPEFDRKGEAKRFINDTGLNKWR